MFAKEGFPFIIAAIILLIIISVLPKACLVVIAILILAMMLWFFRDPERVPPVNDDVFVSAADGKIVEIADVMFEGSKYKKISVFMNVFSVHVNRAPYNGTVEMVRHIPGTFIPADRNTASIVNERNEIHIKTPHGKIIAVQVAGLVARRTVSYVEEGSSVSKGDRIGMIKFSSRVDHYLPADVIVNVHFGEKVQAGTSVIAKIK